MNFKDYFRTEEANSGTRISRERNSPKSECTKGASHPVSKKLMRFTEFTLRVLSSGYIYTAQLVFKAILNFFLHF